MNNAIVTPYGLFGPPEPGAPAVGSTQVFISFSATPITPYAGFCAKVRHKPSFPPPTISLINSLVTSTQPNPISPNGTFIGFPALSVSGHSDKWALCTNTTAGGRVDIVYPPIAIIRCLDVRMWCCRCRSLMLLSSRRWGTPKSANLDAL